MGEKLTAELVVSHLPKRKQNTSKHDYGTLLAVCGSQYYRGAAVLSVSAALRCGVGIVCLASTEKVISATASVCPECTFLPLGESKNGTISKKSIPEIIERSKKCNALLVGCGLALDDDTREVVKTIVTSAGCQLILDADALNVLSDDPALLLEAKLPPIITPHFGEMARLCKKSRADIEKAPEQTALEFAEKYNCTVVLKSHITYIASFDGRCFVNTDVGNAGLAKGGSGDVLAGMISSFVTQQKEPFASACCGVYLHGLSADRCKERTSMTSILPSDVVSEIGALLRELEK